MIEYWPWWSSAVALSAVTVGFWYFVKRPLGVSGSWARVVTWQDDREIAAAEAPFRNNPTMLQDALMRATVEEFGEETVFAALAARRGKGAAATDAVKAVASTTRAPWTHHLVFLVMLAVGGAATMLASGNYQVSFDLGTLHKQLFGTGMGNWITLFMGGALVGFGTQLAGGCTSGHGLSGCSRLVPASLAATAGFFGAAVVISLLLHLSGGAGA